jgi:hypothetical protein
MTVSYIVIMRNPTSRELMTLKDESDRIVEFDEEDDALEAAKENPACRAWGAEILPLHRP